MNFFQSLASPIIHFADRANLATCDFCGRSLLLKNPAARKAGIRMRSNWYCSSRCFTSVAEQEISSLMRSTFCRTDPTPRMPLGLSLVSRGLLDENQFRRIARKQKATGMEFADLLIQDGVISEEQLTSARAALWGCPVFEVPNFPAPVDVSIPQRLVDAHEAVPLHYVRGTKTLLMGFLHSVEYGFLYAVETVVGCKTQACFVSPSGFQLGCEQRRRQLESGEVVRAMEVSIDNAYGAGDMARTLCKMSVEFEADEAVVSKCKDYVWARLKNSDKEIDLVFTAS